MHTYLMCRQAILQTHRTSHESIEGTDTLLHAVSCGNEERVRNLLITKKDTCYTADARGVTPFIRACQLGNVAIAN